MNKAVLVGNLTRDPDSRMTNSGVSVCTFTVAVQRRFTNQAGERQADFIPVVCWRGLADTCSKYIRKGSKVAVSGSIQTRNYEAADGTKRYVTEIIADEVEFCDRAGTQPGEGGRRPSQHQGESQGMDDMSFGEAVDDDDLPF